MRWTAIFLLALSLGGCTTQSTGERCQQNADCNTDTDTCRQETSPARECAGATSCICCPTDPAAALAYPACVSSMGTPVVDAGTPATDNGVRPTTDTGVRPDTGAITPVVDSGMACTNNSGCPIGNFCNGNTCGGAGTCLLRPQTCGGVLNLVCGCDGNTYSNPCEAAQAGVRVSAPGACTTAPDAGARIDAGFPVDTGTPSDLGTTPDVPASVD